MPTKTISIDLEAYERLRRARLTPDESFSHVIKRAHWRDEHKTAAGLLSALEETPLWERQEGLERLFDLFEGNDPEAEIRRLKQEDAGF